MSGPILIMAREKQCIGAGPCIPRQMTEEERLKYASIKPLKKNPAYMLGEKFTPHLEAQAKKYQERKLRIDLLYAMSDVRESNIEKRKKQGRMP